MLPITRSRHDHPSLSGHPLAVIRPTEPACVALPVLGVLPRRHKGVEGERCGTHYQHPPSRLAQIIHEFMAQSLPTSGKWFEQASMIELLGTDSSKLPLMPA
jgi:hypothetical protein